MVKKKSMGIHCSELSPLFNLAMRHPFIKGSDRVLTCSVQWLHISKLKEGELDLKVSKKSE